MKFLNKIFHLDHHQANLKTEIIGGLITFVSMCYILPVNASILSDMGMSSAGVFLMTAFVSFIVTMIMGMVANYPIVLSAGMGLNAFLAYTLSDAMGFTSWQQKMILLTVAGIIFFVFSLTPIRKYIIEAIPKDLKCIISAALGAFICFVGLRNSAIITASSTLVSLNTFADPAVLIGVVVVIFTIGLMFAKNKMVKTMAIPFGILTAAVLGIIVSEILIGTNNLAFVDGAWRYQYGPINEVATKLPIGPWHAYRYDSTITFGINFNAIGDVFFFGLTKDSYSWSNFSSDIGKVFSNPATYVAIFSLIFVNLFDTTATLIAIGEKTGIIDENGKMQNYRKAVIADSTGALICAPLGTSTVTSFAESNVGVSMGAKTGLSACVAAFMFLLSMFIYPIFSIFTAGSVTVPALVCVGLIIMVNSFSGINFKDPVIAFTSLVMVIFAVLCYSISDGIGIGLIAYCVMMLFSGRKEELKLPIVVIAGLFIVSFAATTIIKFL